MRRRPRPTPPPPFGEVVTLRAGALVAGGAARANLDDGRVAFVHFAAPGELVNARIEAVHKDFVEAVATEILEPSADRVAPRCPVFTECGGCQLQHLSYPAQLKAKTEIVREQLRRIGHLDPGVVAPMVGADNPWGYRNHVRFSTGRRFGDLGFVPRTGHGLLRIDCCPISNPRINHILAHLQGKGAGLHQVQIRHNPGSETYLVNPSVPDAPFETGQKEYVEVLADHEFVVSASAFFQVNGDQAEQMIRLIGEALPQRGNVLLDAFAGVGTFAALFAERFERVIAIEESPSAVRDAERNLEDIENVELNRGKVEDVLPALGVPPEAVILDPPRAGCYRTVLDALVQFQPQVIVYVSCNPATFARDARILCDGGYELELVTPVDMFPQTAHIECVSRFVLSGARDV